MDVEKLAVEGFLPTEFFGDLGIFLQTCAHIEQVASAIVTTIEVGAPPERKIGNSGDIEDWLERYFVYRKKMSLKRLYDKLTASKMPPELLEDATHQRAFGLIRQSMRELADLRGVAAHGAFCRTTEGFLRVDYVVPDADSEGFVRSRLAITSTQVHEIIRLSDDILKSLIGILEAVAPGSYVRLGLSVYPVVAHPDKGS